MCICCRVHAWVPASVCMWTLAAARRRPTGRAAVWQQGWRQLAAVRYIISSALQSSKCCCAKPATLTAKWCNSAYGSHFGACMAKNDQQHCRNATYAVLTWLLSSSQFDTGCMEASAGLTLSLRILTLSSSNCFVMLHTSAASCLACKQYDMQLSINHWSHA